jgi:ABC-type lipoprotein release transport system permease subunit
MLLFLAARNLLASPLLSALLVLAVAGALAFQVPNTGNLLGYNAELIRQGVTSGPGAVRVRPRTGPLLRDGRALAARFAQDPEVAAAVPILTLPGALLLRDRFLGAPVSGLPPDAGGRPILLLSGALLQPGDAEGVLLGASLAARLGAKAGDVVQLRVFLPGDGGASELQGDEMIVRGVIGGSFGASEGAFVERGFLTAAGERTASLVMVYTADPLAAPRVAARLAAQPGAGEALILPWMEDDPFLGAIVRGNDTLGLISQSMGVVSVTIPVWALLYVHVQRRRRDIGILAALGLGRGALFLVFLAQALIVGVLGVAAGAALGYGLLRYFQAHPVFDWQGFVIRPIISSACFIRPVLLILATTVLAGVYPAARAARLDPARILRGIE